LITLRRAIERSPAIGAAVLLVALLLAIGACQTTSNGGNTGSQMPAVGDAAPALQLSAMTDGKEVSFPAFFRGRSVLLSFFSLG